MAAVDTQTWLKQKGWSLEGKWVAITGATGGLGTEACRGILRLSGSLILVNRSREKSERLCEQLRQEFPQGQIEVLQADLTDMSSVRWACEKLKQKPLDVLVLNAGAYHIPRAICETGWDNVFQTNFVSHYDMVKELLPVLTERRGKVVAIGSIGHYLAKADKEDVDFAKCSKPVKVYGNSKRYLMFALAELMRQHPEVSFAIAHPGVSFTNITSHYPKPLVAIIKWPMKLIYMKPEKAVRSLLQGICEEVPYLHWIGPGVWNIWGNPKVKALTDCKEAERRQIYTSAEQIYEKCKGN